MSNSKYDISLIAAVAANGVIGGNGKLLWRFPKDMKRFVELTTGHTVVMGRKTHESIGKTLLNRHNLVLTKSDIRDSHSSGQIDHYSFAINHPELILEISKTQPVFVIGGEAIYREFLPYAHTMHITNIQSPYIGDTYFPEFPELEWRIDDEVHHDADDKHPYPFDFITLKRIFN